MSGDKQEFDGWARAREREHRIRAAWIAEFKLEGYRIVKLKRVPREDPHLMHHYRITDEL